MATQQLLAPIPSLILAPGMRIRFEAIDPATGVAVAGVKVKAIAISGAGEASADAVELRPGGFMLVPGPGE